MLFVAVVKIRLKNWEHLGAVMLWQCGERGRKGRRREGGRERGRDRFWFTSVFLLHFFCHYYLDLIFLFL